MENDEPLFFSSSSDEEQDEDEPIREEAKEREATAQPINTRKRPAAGHTPLDLAKCQKVTLQNKRHCRINTNKDVQLLLILILPKSRPLLLTDPITVEQTSVNFLLSCT